MCGHGELCRGTGLPHGLTTAGGAVGASGEYLNLRKLQEFEVNHARDSLQSLVFRSSPVAVMKDVDTFLRENGQDSQSWNSSGTVCNE